MKEKLSSRQVLAFCLTALSAPVVTVCAGLPWPWVLAVSIFAAAVFLGMLALWRGGGQTMPRLFLRAWGRPAGCGILLAQAVFAVLVLWRFVPLTDSAFPESPTLPFVPLTLLAVAAWAAWHGRAAMIRAVSVLFFFLAGLYLLVFAFSLPDAQLDRLKQWGESVSLVPLAVLLLPTYGFYLTHPEGKGQKLPLLWAAALVLLPAGVSALCAAIPGSRGSLYEMAKSIEVFSVALRLEPLVSALLTLGWFAAVGLLAVSVGEMADAAGLSARWAGVAVCVLAAPAAVWDLSLPTGLLAGLGAVFCVIIPLLTLFMVGRKKG